MSSQQQNQPQPGTSTNNPMQPHRLVFENPTWRVAKNDWEVNVTNHLDDSVTEDKPANKDSIFSYHSGEIPANLADRVKVEWYNLMFNDAGYTIGELKIFFVEIPFKSRARAAIIDAILWI